MFVIVKDTQAQADLASQAQAVKRIQVQAARPTMGPADPVTLVPADRNLTDRAAQKMMGPVDRSSTGLVALVTQAPADPHTMDREDPVTRALVVTVRNVQKFVRGNSANRTEHSRARRTAHSTSQNNLR